MQNHSLPDIALPHVKRKTLVALPLTAPGAFAGLCNQVYFYNEAGRMAHVRTIFGEEKGVAEVGYATPWFGRTTVISTRCVCHRWAFSSFRKLLPLFPHSH